MRNKNILYWLILTLIIITVIFHIKDCNNSIGNKNSKLIESLNDSISYYRDENGVLHSKITAIEVDNIEKFKKLNIKNEEIKELQKLIKKYKDVQSATVFKTKTEIKEIFKTDTVVVNDTLLPVYKSDFMLYGGTDKLQVYGHIRMEKDSTALELHMIDRFKIVTHKEKDKIILDISNENPYSVTESQRAVIKIPKQKRIGLGVNAGYGISKSGLSPYIGLGVNYNLLNF